MPEENQMVDLLKYLYGKRRQILLWTGTAAILSVVFSLLMPDYYKASTTFYASAQSLASPESIFGSKDGNMYFFGGDADVDRLLAIGKSREVSDYIIEKYNLVDHYDVDTTTLKGKEQLMLKFSDQLEIVKNKFDAIELSFEDKERTLVDDVANDCRYKINEIALHVVRENQERMIEVCQENINKNQRKLESVEDSISSITSNYGIINAQSQGEQISSLIVSTEASISDYSARYDYLLKNATESIRDTLQFIKATLEGLKQKKSKLNREELVNFSKGAGRLVALQQIQEQLSKRVGYDIDRLQQLNSAFNSDISALVTVEEAREPYIKSRPKRSIIVLAATFGTFVFSILLLLLVRNIRQMSWKETK
ncbi:MAG TPA: hypothetical protein VJ917_11090 [Saprospiraceae bacterium]|nr:hypothetical protein [Saprospiraceae bacterium]